MPESRFLRSTALWPPAPPREVDVVGLGQISLDRVVAVPRWPAPGEKLALAAPSVERPGGQIATALLAATRLGLRARLLGAVGDDAAGEAALAPLRGAGLDLAGVCRVAGAPTRSALVLVGGDGERSVLGFRAAGLALDPARLSRDAVRGGRALLVDAEDPDATRWAVGVARAAGIPIALDAEVGDRERLAIARSVDFPIVSEGFFQELSSGSCISEALASLAGPAVRMAVVTRGARGAVARLDGCTLEQPALPVAAVDTTGAGDVFRGAFLWALLRGESARRVLCLAATAAALACRGHGAQGALPTAAQVEARAPSDA